MKPIYAHTVYRTAWGRLLERRWSKRRKILNTTFINNFIK